MLIFFPTQFGPFLVVFTDYATQQNSTQWSLQSTSLPTATWEISQWSPAVGSRSLCCDACHTVNSQDNVNVKPMYAITTSALLIEIQRPFVCLHYKESYQGIRYISQAPTSPFFVFLSLMYLLRFIICVYRVASQAVLVFDVLIVHCL